MQSLDSLHCTCPGAMELVWGRGILWNLRDQTDMVCIILYMRLYAGNFAAHSDMPLPCGLPEGKAASLLPPGTTMLLAFICASNPGANRVYLCPSAVAGIYNKSWRLGLCHSSRELVMTVQKASELSLCNFHFKLLGALTVVPHSPLGLDLPLSGGVAQGKCSNAALKRLPTSGT